MNCFQTVNGDYIVCEDGSLEKNIKIEKENECPVCGKYFMYRKCFVKEIGDDLATCRLITTHASCSRVVNKIKRLKRELLDQEFELFLLKFKERT